MRPGWLLTLAAASLLLITGCSVPDEEKIISSTAGPGGQGSESGGEAGEPGSETGTQPDAESGADPDGPAGIEGDYVIVDGERLPVMFSGFTVDESKVAARTINRHCEPNYARTGQFQAWGYLVDDNGQVLTSETAWFGLVRISLNTREDVELAPYVDVELDDRGLWLSLVDPNPRDPDGGFTVDGNVATGDFLVPDMNGGPDQRVEFQVTCPVED